MFGLITGLAKAAVGVATLPVSVAMDVVTIGGALNDKPRPYTADTVSDVIENLTNATDPNK